MPRVTRSSDEGCSSHCALSIGFVCLCGFCALYMASSALKIKIKTRKKQGKKKTTTKNPTVANLGGNSF